MKHRNANFRFSFCGKKCEPEEMTLLDSEVDCKECRGRLKLMQYTDTKTDTLIRLKNGKFIEKGDND